MHIIVYTVLAIATLWTTASGKLGLNGAVLGQKKGPAGNILEDHGNGIPIWFHDFEH